MIYVTSLLLSFSIFLFFPFSLFFFLSSLSPSSLFLSFSLFLSLSLSFPRSLYISDESTPRRSDIHHMPQKYMIVNIVGLTKPNKILKRSPIWLLWTPCGHPMDPLWTYNLWTHYGPPMLLSALNHDSRDRSDLEPHTLLLNGRPIRSNMWSCLVHIGLPVARLYPDVNGNFNYRAPPQCPFSIAIKAAMKKYALNSIVPLPAFTTTDHDEVAQ
jgi:hypothetical protein